MDLLTLVQDINGILWNYILIFLLCGTGIYYTFRLKFVQVRLFKAAFVKAFGGLNLFGGLRRAMAKCGYRDLKEFQKVGLVLDQ